MDRPTFDEMFLDMAERTSRRATCPRLKVGAVVAAADHTLIGSGYNGAPSGEAHCTEAGCLIRDDHCVRVIHAEDNALWYSQRDRLKGGTLYLYNSAPCLPCVQKILRAGIARVVCHAPAGLYDNEGWGYLAAAGIEVELEVRK